MVQLSLRLVLVAMIAVSVVLMLLSPSLTGALLESTDGRPDVVHVDQELVQHHVQAHDTKHEQLQQSITQMLDQQKQQLELLHRQQALLEKQQEQLHQRARRDPTHASDTEPPADAVPAVPATAAPTIAAAQLTASPTAGPGEGFRVMMVSVGKDLVPDVRYEVIPPDHVWKPERSRQVALPKTRAEEDKHLLLPHIRSTMLRKGAHVAPVPGVSRIMCLLPVHLGKPEFIFALRDSWLPECDGHALFINPKDAVKAQKMAGPTVRIIGLEFEGEEKWENMWHKSRAMWLTAHDLLDRKQYDWWMWGGHDVYLNVDNFREYVASAEILERHKSGEAMLLGHRAKLAAPWGSGYGQWLMSVSEDRKRDFNLPDEEVSIPQFPLGGAGYFLNSHGIELYAKTIRTYHFCSKETPSSAEDVMVAACMRYQGVLPYDTREASGAERFHPFTPDAHIIHMNAENRWWYHDYTFDVKFGAACCSNNSITYHYMPADYLLLAHKLIERERNT